MSDDLEDTIEDLEEDLDDDVDDERVVDEYEELVKELEKNPEEAPETPVEEPVVHSPPKENTVPQARFNEVNQRAKEQAALIEAQRLELEALRQKQLEVQKTKEEPPVDIKALQLELKEAILEDDNERYEQLQEEIRLATLKQAEQLMEQKLAQRDQERLAREQARLDELARQEFDFVFKKWTALYPEIDENSESFNPELWDDVVTFQRAMYNKGGISGAEALDKVLTKLMPASPVPTSKQPDVIDERTKRSVARGIEKSKQTPPNITNSSTGNRAAPPNIDVLSMTEEQFNALPKAEIDRLKGKTK